MPWKLNRETIPKEFLEPVPTFSRIGDYSCLLLGLTVAAFALQTGGAALIALPFGLAATAAGIWLLLHRNHMILPPTIALRGDDKIKRRLGQQASTPQTRATYMREYLSAVSKFGMMTRDLWLASLSVGRGPHDTYESFAHFKATGSGVVVSVTPTTEELFLVRVSGLTPTQHENLEDELGLPTTIEPDVTLTKRDTAKDTLATDATSEPTVEVPTTGSAEATATAIEHLFTQVACLGYDYVLTAQLGCRPSTRTVGDAER